MKKKLQVFISSTFIDMKEERQAAVEALLKSGNIPAGMELFTSGNESQMETITRWIDDSDIYLLLLGGRYGTIEKTTGLSYTEVEYNYAISQKKPFFSIVIEEGALLDKNKKFKSFEEKENPDKLSEFRSKVLSSITSFYSDIKEIKLAIHETLQDFKARYEFHGWVKGDLISDIETLTQLNLKMQNEIEKLKKEQINVIPADAEIINQKKEYEDLIHLLGKIIITTDKLNSKNVQEDFSLLKLLLKFRTALVAGINNKLGLSDLQKFLFFNILPRLAIHDLAENIPVPGVQYRLFKLNKKGLNLLSYIEKKIQ